MPLRLSLWTARLSLLRQRNVLIERSIPETFLPRPSVIVWLRQVSRLVMWMSWRTLLTMPPIGRPIQSTPLQRRDIETCIRRMRY